MLAQGGGYGPVERRRAISHDPHLEDTLSATTSLAALLIALGIPPSPRYSIEDVARILGLTPKQVRNQVKKNHLIAVRGSRRRWTGVLHEDLSAYFAMANGGTL